MKMAFKRIVCLLLAWITVVSLLPVMPLQTEAACTTHSWKSTGRCEKCGAVFDYLATRTDETGTLTTTETFYAMSSPYSAGAGGSNLKTKAGKNVTLTGSVRYIAKVKNAYGKNWYEVRLEDGRTGYIYATDTQVKVTASEQTNVVFVLNNKYDSYNVYEAPYSDTNKKTSTSIPKGTYGIATGIIKNSLGNCWYKVSINGITGWVPASHCDAVGLAPGAVTVSSLSNLGQYKKNSGGKDMTEVLTATGCSITKVVAAFRDPNGNPKNNINGVNQWVQVNGSYTTFNARNTAIQSKLSPRKMPAGLYQYTLDIDVKVRVATDKSITDKTFANIRILSDSFESYNSSASALILTLNPNGGTCAQKEVMVYSGKPIGKLTEPKKVGDTFAGWYTAKSDGTKVTESSTFTKAQTIYARWESQMPKTYSITYDANGGSGAPGTQSKNKGASLTLSSAVPTRSGHNFLGWAKNKTATKADYAAGKTHTYTTDADMTLYAVWETVITYPVTYYPNGSGVTDMPKNGQKTKDQKYTVSSTVPKRTGYVFKNWNTSADPKWNDPPISPNEDYLINQKLDLYAQWEVIEYEVKYDPNGGSYLGFKMGNTEHTYDKEKKLNSNKYWKSGYEFSGWNTKADGSGKSYQNKEKVKNLTSKDGAVVTLYAQWKKKGETPKETQPAPKETTPETQPVTKPTQPPKDPTPAKTLPNQTVRIPTEAEMPKDKKSPASYKPAQTYDDVEAIVMDYWNTVTNYGQNKAYWNNHIRAKNTTKTEPFLNTITRTPCTHTPTHYHTGGTCPGSKSNESGCTHGCTSNGFWYSDNNYQAQCEGFSYYMAWVVFGKLHTDTTAYTRIDRTALSADYKIKPGDILRAKWNWSKQKATHSMFVYKVENGIAYYIECNYSDTAPSGCRIFNKRSLNAKKMVEILRETPEGYVLSSKAVPSLKSYTIKFDANKPSGAKNPTGTMEDQKGWIGGKTYLNPNTFAIKSYVFDGWNTSADGSGKKFLDKATIAQNLTEKEGDTVILYAQWKEQDQVKYPTNLEFVLNEKYDSYNVYAEPYSDSVTRNSTEIPAGTHGIATEIVKNNHDNWWYHVNINGIDGWISGDNCDAVGPAPQAVTFSQYTNLAKLKSDGGTYDMKDILHAHSCTVTKITGAFTDKSGNNPKNSFGNVQKNTVTGEYPSFNVKTGAGKAFNDSKKCLTPRKIPAGLYEYTLVVSIRLKIIEGKQMKDETYDNICILTDPFEVQTNKTVLTITLDPKGGSCHQKEILVYKDDPIGELPEPVFVGKTFLGWYTEAEGGEKVTEKNTFTKNTTLYARWSSTPKPKEKVYTVVYDPNGGTGTMEKSTHVVGAYGPLTKNGFTRPGYDFDGWSGRADGKGTKFTDGQEVMNLTNVDKSEVTLYATWKLSAGEEYLKLCTLYPSHMKLAVSSLISGKLMTAPHDGSNLVRKLTAAEGLISTALYKNSKGEFWYQVKANKDGKTGYVYAGDTLALGIANKTVTFNVALEKTSITKGFLCNLVGSVKAGYNILYSVTGVLNDSDPATDAQTQTITAGFDNVQGTILNTGLAFADLSRGKGTLNLTATLRSAYSSGRNLYWETYTTGKYPLDFRIIGVYNVVYDKNTIDNVLYVPGKQNKTDGVDLKLSDSVPYRVGYTFLGWAKKAKAERPDYQPKDYLREDTDTGNLTLYALWSDPHQYTITFDANGGTGAPAPAKATYGKSFYYPAEKPEKPGCTFLGWSRFQNVDGNSANAEKYLLKAPQKFTSDTILYAVWRQDEFTVTFHANGGEGGLTETKVRKGELLRLGTDLPTRENHSFEGWAETPDAITPTYYPGNGYTIDRDITLYAVWKEETWTVTYLANGIGVTNVPDPQEKQKDSDLYLSNQTPQRLGDTFLGWSDAPDSREILYHPGDKYTANENITLYAVWTGGMGTSSYAVTYYANGGTGEPTAQTKTHGTPLTLTKDEPEREGHQFLGWAESSDATAPTYQPGGSYTLDREIKLYAVWVRIYTVTYDANGGTGAPAAQKKVHGVDLQVSQQWPTRDGYYCMGWATSRDAMMPNVGGTYTVDEDVTFYAVWREDSSAAVTCTVTFNANGGEGGLTEAKVTKGELLRLGTDLPSREHHSFEGWAETPDATTPTYYPGNAYTIDRDITLYAVWVRLYTVTFDPNGGYHEPQPQTKKHGVDLLLSNVEPRREAMQFIGWAHDPNADEPSVSNYYRVDADVTLYAVWWDLGGYNLYYEANGGVGGENWDFIRHNEPCILTTDVPTREGYLFTGWSENQYAETADYFPNDVFTEKRDLTLYAIWEENVSDLETYDVTFDLNGGMLGPRRAVKVQGRDMALPDYLPKRAHYNFLGWAKRNDATEPDFPVTGDWTYKEDAAITLYAIWERITFTVSYESTGGTGYPASQIKYSGEPLTIAAEIPTRKGFTFVGWSANKDGYGVDYLPGDTFDRDESLTLYALWKRAESLIYDANAGTYWVFDYETVETKACEAFDLSNLCHIVIAVNPSEEIRQWYFATEEEPDRSIQDWYDENCSSGNILGAPLKVADGKLDFYVTQDNYPIQIGIVNTGLNSLQVRTDETFRLDVQQVTFYANGGIFSMGTTAFEVLESPSHPLIRGGTGFEIPVRDGYTFAGWATSADAQVPTYSAHLQYEAVDPEVTELYAVWQEN